MTHENTAPMRRCIYIVGLNHKTAGVDIRERFALANRCTPDQWPIPCASTQGQGIGEVLILSTCNRVEILAVEKMPSVAAKAEDDTSQSTVVEHILKLWAHACNQDVDVLRPHVYVHRQEEAIRHLFRVASSLDSMVLGEPQILGQLKDAYRKAVENKSSGTIINRLLHKAFSAAKRVRTETAIASSAVSISYAAVELAKRIFGHMNAHRAMLVGAGEMAELAATHLLQAGINHIYVANRTMERGQELAEQFQGTAIAFDKLVDHLVDVDIIITSTGATEPILCAKDVQHVLRLRKHRPMFFIDIAVPRDIDPDVNALDNVYLYDIDDLKEVVEENLAHRRDEALKAGNIVQDEVLLFRHWLASLDVQPTIVDIIHRAERLGAEELQRTLKKLHAQGAVDAHIEQALTAMVGALVRKLNHAPIAFLKDGGQCSQSLSARALAKETSESRISIVRRIFDLDKGQ